nr:phage holin family protein [uncultured Sphingomonas sp.]
MRQKGGDNQDQPIAEFVGRLLDDGKAYATAEFELLKAKAEKSANAYRRPVALAAVAVGLAFSALIVLCISIVIALASLIGPLLGGLLATLIVGSAAAIVAILAKSAFEDANEG